MLFGFAMHLKLLWDVLFVKFTQTYDVK